MLDLLLIYPTSGGTKFSLLCTHRTHVTKFGFSQVDPIITHGWSLWAPTSLPKALGQNRHSSFFCPLPQLQCDSSSSSSSSYQSPILTTHRPCPPDHCADCPQHTAQSRACCRHRPSGQGSRCMMCSWLCRQSCWLLPGCTRRWLSSRVQWPQWQAAAAEQTTGVHLLLALTR